MSRCASPAVAAPMNRRWDMFSGAAMEACLAPKEVEGISWRSKGDSRTFKKREPARISSAAIQYSCGRLMITYMYNMYIYIYRSVCIYMQLWNYVYIYICIYRACCSHRRRLRSQLQVSWPAGVMHQDRANRNLAGLVMVCSWWWLGYLLLVQHAKTYIPII